MYFRNTTVAALALAMTLTSSLALAQQGRGQMGRFADMDADGDGQLSRQELLDSAESVFYAMDADSNEKLTLEEYMSLRMGQQQGNNGAMQAARQAEKEARFQPMDADGDGLVSLKEFTDAAAARFDAADSDGNGRLMRPEWGNGGF